MSSIPNDYRVRYDALTLAATAFASEKMSGTNVGADLWSLAVFFETYLREGSAGTRQDFGPKGPARLKTIGRSVPPGLGG